MVIHSGENIFKTCFLMTLVSVNPAVYSKAFICLTFESIMSIQKDTETDVLAQLEQMLNGVFQVVQNTHMVRDICLYQIHIDRVFFKITFEDSGMHVEEGATDYGLDNVLHSRINGGYLASIS